MIVTTSSKHTTINGMTRQEINTILHQLHQEEANIRRQYHTLIMMRNELDYQAQQHKENQKEYDSIFNS